MECLTAIASPIVEEITRCALNPVRRHLNYLFSYKSNIEIFKVKLNELKAARTAMQRLVDEERTSGKEIFDEVKEWMNEVDKIIQDAEDFCGKEEQAKTTCSGGLSCPNWSLRHRGSKEAKTMMRKCEDSVKREFSIISYRPVVDYLSLSGFETFVTRTKAMTHVMEALKDENVRRIGVYGMAGVGKTMFAKKVGLQAKADNLFSRVIFTTVSQARDDENIKRIQQEIADQLGLELKSKESTRRRAAQLSHQLSDWLKQEDKILIIIDDIWGSLDFSDTIGICFKESQDKCKVLMTSRNQDVLESYMMAEKCFPVEILTTSEATNLFTKIVGNKIEDPHFRKLGTDLISECAGLPLAVTTIAHMLKRKNINSWEEALRQLQSGCWPPIKEVEVNVSKSIMLSYNFLDEREDLKKLLLLCSLHGEDEEISVHDLMRCGVGLGLFHRNHKFEVRRNKVRSWLDELKDRCLLLSGVNYDTVKMHDVIRDVIIAIPSKGASMYNYTDFAELAEEEQAKSTAISLLGSDSLKLPQRLECPNLKLFLMLKASQSLLIPEQFFDGAKELRVLYLASVEMSLPPSFGDLQNIKILCFHNCKLRDLSLIGKMKSLEALYLSSSYLEKFPEEIGQLTELRLLCVENCPSLKVIPLHVISSLKHLEEFNMGEAFIDWEINQGVEVEISSSCLSESTFSRMSTLRLKIKDGGVLPYDSFDEAIEFHQLRSLTLQYLHASTSNSPVLLFNEKVAFPSLEALKFSETGLENLWPDQLPTSYFKTLKTLSVWRCNNLRHLLTLAVFQRFVQLEYLEIEECNGMEEVLFAKIEPASDDEGRIRKILFPQLKLLKLWDLPNLTRFWAGNSVECPSLQKLDIKCCPKLNTFIERAR